jgi:hypothetical protein
MPLLRNVCGIIAPWITSIDGERHRAGDPMTAFAWPRRQKRASVIAPA